MLLASHAIIGAASGSLSGGVATSFVIGTISHFAIDAIPHYDTTDNGKYTLRQILLIAIDAAIGISVLFFLLNQTHKSNIYLLWGALGGIFPDLVFNLPIIKNVAEKLPVLKNIALFHQKIQSRNLNPIPGILVQLLIITLGAVFIYFRGVL